jgi:DNA invertase Pin-like site-specific DNA recombinase
VIRVVRKETIKAKLARLGGGAAAYVRVSSRAQSYAMQYDAVETLAAARGDKFLHWYTEKRSAKTTARPELARLRTDVREGRVRRLYVFRLDRLARSGIRDTFEIVEELRAAQCELVTVSDGFELGGPAADVILAVMAWAAQMERNAIGERIASARELASKRGTPWGRPSRVAPALLAKIGALRKEGKTIRTIAMALKVPKSTVERALRPKEEDAR